MASLVQIFAVACGVLFRVNEASIVDGVSVKVSSKKEILANMTDNIAVDTILGMSCMQEYPELTELLRSQFGQGLGADQHHASMIASHSKLRGLSQPSGNGGIDTATQMLNGMTEQTQGGLEAEEFRCTTFQRKTRRALESMRTAVSNFNAEAAAARGLVVKAQGQIGTITVALVQSEEDFNRHKKECEEEILGFNEQLTVVEADIKVMATILKFTDCNKEAGDGGEDDSSLFLIQCRHCSDAYMIQHGPVQQMLGQLRSRTARQFIQNSLEVSYRESLIGGKAVALTQDDIERMHGHRQDGSSSPQKPGVNTSDVPTAPKEVDCQPTKKCSIGGSPNCKKLKDRFLNVQAGIVDKRDELEGMIGKKQNFCEEQTEAYTNQIDGMQTRLREQQTNLAVGTQQQNQAETGSHQKSQQHEKTATEYSRTLQECCDNQNQAKQEICALEKIRGELLKMEGKSLDISDCDVSEWREEECSKTCAGGIMKKVRSVIVQPKGGGTRCPPLEATEPCNEDPCPVDCHLGDWGGWSACSADCGGGVLERTRPIAQQPLDGGEPCEETEDAAACNIQSCDVDCELSDWSDWGSCSKACGRGSQRRSKSIATAAHGQGHCAGPMEGGRLGFKPCNPESCAGLIPQGRSLLNCNSKVDVIILVDGSASLGYDGWKQTMSATSKLITSLNGGQSEVFVALQVFSGPESWEDYSRCTGGATQGEEQEQEEFDMEKRCGVKWVSHFTQDTKSLVARLKGRVGWPKESTLTSVALGQADSELVKGRSDANSVVIVITDGYPMSEQNTKAAAKQLVAKAKVLWVPVTQSAPLDLIQEMASLPKEEHIIRASSFQSLGSTWILNQIIAGTCPIVS